jgi:pimeloyl-ACP methyl ester carboxylesterase
VSHLVLCATSGGVDVAACGGAEWRPNYRSTWPGAPAWAFERPADLSEALAALDIPTLLIWAQRDPISPVAVGKRLAELLPRARLIILDADEHMFAPSHAQEVAQAIEAHVFRSTSPVASDMPGGNESTPR